MEKSLKEANDPGSTMRKLLASVPSAKASETAARIYPAPAGPTKSTDVLEVICQVILEHIDDPLIPSAGLKVLRIFTKGFNRPEGRAQRRYSFFLIA